MVRIRTRIFLGILIVVGIGFSSFLLWIMDDLKPQYRKITEEPLIDASRTLASVAAMTAQKGKIDVNVFRKIFQYLYSQSFSAKIYDFEKQEVDFRVYITDVSGRVIFDSNRGQDEGKDYSQWIDVRRTLKGEYGARTSRDIPDNPASVTMYVASPIIINDEIVGVLSVGKPTKTTNLFIEHSKEKIIIIGIIISLSAIFVGLILSWMITMPIQRLTAYAKAVRNGKRITFPKLGRNEIRELGTAFEEMLSELEGKHYIENYVQTLTHEIKSPLSAIQGAAELLKEDMSPEQQNRFLTNILEETERIRTIIEKLLLLSSLENRKSIQDVEHLNMKEIVTDVKETMLPLLKAKGMTFEITGDDACFFDGDRFLVRQAVVNLLQNAIDFSPQGEKVTASISKNVDSSVILTIKDHGSGIPRYALEKVFERFYSLKRPATGRKSSGLGLSLVKEVALLHNGSIELQNAPDGGVAATLIFPHSYIAHSLFLEK